jgi:TPR repeat protein
VINATAPPAHTIAMVHENGPAAAEAIARLQQTVARLESRPVDAWLERRLRELERSLSALEGRRVESSTVEKSVEERFRDLGQNLEGLEHRVLATAEDTAHRFSQSLDACEIRLRQLLSETQGDAAVLARRLTAVENAAFAAKPDFFATPVEARAAEPELASPPESASALGESANAEPIVSSPADPAPFLAAARRSAQAAAQAQVVHVRKRSRRKSETMVYLTMGSLFLFVAMLTAMGLLLRNQALDDKSVAAARPAQTSAAASARRRVVSSPADPKSRLRNLAQAGDPAAELLVGMNYLNGPARNDGAAFAWLSRAATHNQPLAEYQLALMYQKGLGVRADPAQAFHWFESAALHGNRKAMHGLATCYAEGWGTQKNLTEAARWFARAAALGSVNDQFNLGVLYERGMGVPQSLVDAYRWYAIAAAAGDQESQARIAALAPTLSPEDMAAARGAADSFKPAPLSTAANLFPDSARLN